MLEEIDINKLVPNDYNPPNRANRSIESLSSSLKNDGQIATITVRPVGGGKFEIVDGTRRFESAKKTGLKKMLCNTIELSRDAAMDYNYIANKETEPDSAMDEAWRFFERLGLAEEQLFQEPDRKESLIKTREGEGPQVVKGLPSDRDASVQALAKRLGVSPNRIDMRLPLMALPPKLVDLLEKGEMPIGVTQEIARLRLIGNKDEAQKLMVEIWRKWGREPIDVINRHVTDVIKTYQQESDKLLKELETIEKNLDNRMVELNRWVDDDMGSWFDPNAKNNIRDELPEELLENGIEIPEFISRNEEENPGVFARRIFEMSDNLTMSITRNDTLETMKDDLDIKVDKLAIGLRELKNDMCVFCGHQAQKKEIEGRIDMLNEDLVGFEEKLEKKDAVRGNVEKLKRELGTLIRKYDNVVDKYRTSLDKLLKSENIPKDVYDEKMSNYRLEV